jgi:hypothetical protein
MDGMMAGSWVELSVFRMVDLMGRLLVVRRVAKLAVLTGRLLADSLVEMMVDKMAEKKVVERVVARVVLKAALLVGPMAVK